MGNGLDLKKHYSDIELHLIGPLQTNKTRQAFDLFDVIQTLDRMKLAKSFANLVQEKGVCPIIIYTSEYGRRATEGGSTSKEN